MPDAAYLPAAEVRPSAGSDGRDVHAIVYRPHNAGLRRRPTANCPPFVVFVHGGPTAHCRADAVDLENAYFTSRGIGVVDVNYGGSTGYGREYRERLRGQWGVVDVEDAVAAAPGAGRRRARRRRAAGDQGRLGRRLDRAGRAHRARDAFAVRRVATSASPSWSASPRRRTTSSRATWTA